MHIALHVRWAWAFIAGLVAEIIFLFMCRASSSSNCVKVHAENSSVLATTSANFALIVGIQWCWQQKPGVPAMGLFHQTMCLYSNEPLAVSSQLQHKPQDYQEVPWDCDCRLKVVADTAHSQSMWKRKLLWIRLLMNTYIYEFSWTHMCEFYRCMQAST